LSRIVRALGALVTVLAVAGVAALGTLSVMRARDDGFARVNADARERARIIATIVHDAVQDDFNAVVSTSARPFFRTYIASKNYRQAAVLLSELITTHRRLTSIAVYDAGGALAYRIPGDASLMGKRFGQQEYFNAARNTSNPHISDLFIQLSKPKVPVIAYSIRVGYRAGVYGVLVGSTAITEFDDLVEPFAPAGSTVRIYNKSGEQISPAKEASAKTYKADPIVGPALGGQSSVRRATGSIVAAEPVADYGWAVVVSQPARVADKSVQDLVERLSWLAGGATLLALIATTAAWRRRRREG
jgi:hypothetical protein